jgi:hypothetical protein
MPSSSKASQSPEHKAAALEQFQDGGFRVLVTKPSHRGFGMNFQNAHRMAFVGLSDSWEAYYQCIRRCWRFGQTVPVEASWSCPMPRPRSTRTSWARSEEAARMQERLIEHVAALRARRARRAARHVRVRDCRDGRATELAMMLGDSVERMRELGDRVGRPVRVLAAVPVAVHLLAVLSGTSATLGRATSSGATSAYLDRGPSPGHQAGPELRGPRPAGSDDVAHDGVTGLKDFRGDVIRGFIERGWVFHGEVTIDKDPQAQAIRTKAKGLLFVQKDRDRSWLRPAFADYILVFRKPGENAAPIRSDEV